MNTYITAYGTDIGTKKKVNQDSLCVKIAVVKDKTVCMAVLCDGMGGLSKGELASATVVLLLLIHLLFQQKFFFHQLIMP